MSRTRSLSKLIGPSGSQASVKATSFVGDASSLTGLPAGYADSDVATYLLSNGISNIVSAASDPSVGSAGKVYYNTTLGLLKASDGSAWFKVSAEIAVLSSISGTIYNTVAGNITLTGTGFLTASCVVTFTVGGTNYTVTKTADNDTTISAVAVPSAVYNSAAGTSVLIKVTNSDGSTSATVSTTIIGLPVGGTITSSGGYRIHTFTSSGTLATPAGFSSSVDYLLVGGGGGGGSGCCGTTQGEGGGGGAGGMLTGTSSVSASTNYTITVGSGAAGAVADTQSNGSDGGNTTGLGLTAIGGGGGGGRGGPGGVLIGRPGGSGGGGGQRDNNTQVSYGAGTSGQGNNGGQGSYSSGAAPSSGGGGGGGKSAVGADAPNNDGTIGGNGGAGATSSISGSSVAYAGGGGGSAGNGGTRGVGGTGGGGSGLSAGSNNTTPGTANTGGGGGGGGGSTPGTPGGAGGSGIAIIRYSV